MWSAGRLSLWQQDEGATSMGSNAVCMRNRMGLSCSWRFCTACACCMQLICLARQGRACRAARRCCRSSEAREGELGCRLVGGELDVLCGGLSGAVSAGGGRPAGKLIDSPASLHRACKPQW